MELSKSDELIFQSAEEHNKKAGILNINLIIEMLQKHFSEKLSSRLPVIAIYSIYEILIPASKRYETKNSTEIKTFHIERWIEILKEYGTDIQ